MAPHNSSLALVFPGQGCQFVGMGAELYARYPEARAVFDRADEVLGFSLTSMSFEGPEDALNDTANTQPAIYTMTYALWRAVLARMGEAMPRPAFAAGHSLGEFSALAVSGAVAFEDGLRLVRLRGEAMRDSGDRSPGGMAVILGLDDDAVARIVEEASDGSRVWIANLNSPGQVVIAGERDALQRALQLALERKAKRAVPLAVSVACHTPLMRSAAERLGRALEECPISQPSVPIVSNVTARLTQDPQQIRDNLIRQLTEPVRWVESVRAMAEAGVSAMLEVGPKSVIAGLVKRIDPSISVTSVTDHTALEALKPEEVGA